MGKGGLLMKLYSYYRSSAAYRVRIALYYKNIPFDMVAVNILKKENLNSDYQHYNPQMRVPTLIDGELILGQSTAILEYLEENYPQPSLLPAETKARAWVRYFSQIIACDMHPLNNASVIRYIKESFEHSEAESMQWYYHWLREGFSALETLLQQQSKKGRFCFGHDMTFADIYLIPQVYNAIRFKFSMDDYPEILRINEHCLTLDCFVQASPEQQPDFISI